MPLTRGGVPDHNRMFGQTHIENLVTLCRQLKKENSRLRQQQSMPLARLSNVPTPASTSAPASACAPSGSTWPPSLSHNSLLLLHYNNNNNNKWAQLQQHNLSLLSPLRDPLLLPSSLLLVVVPVDFF